MVMRGKDFYYLTINTDTKEHHIIEVFLNENLYVIEDEVSYYTLCKELKLEELQYPELEELLLAVLEYFNIKTLEISELNKDILFEEDELCIYGDIGNYNLFLFSKKAVRLVIAKLASMGINFCGNCVRKLYKTEESSD